MKKITLLLVAFFATLSVSYGQVSSYSFAQSNGTYIPITGGTVLGDTAVDDQRFIDPAVPLGGSISTGVGFPIGFNFNFNGFDYDSFGVNANGWIALGSTSLTPSVNLNTSSAYTPLSTTAVENTNDLVARIAGLGRDLQSQVGGELRYELTGTSPNQILIVQWTNYRKWTAMGDSFNFQIKLYETTNLAEVVYGTMTSNTTATTVHSGLRANPAAVASNFNSRTTSTNWNTSTASVAAGNSLALSATIFPLSGLTFTWTPPLPCSGIPVAGTVTPATLNICQGALPGNLVLSGFTTGVSGITFQWQESLDNFATAGVPAVGGSGATTSTYTPPVYAGTPIFYRAVVTCVASGESVNSTSSAVENPNNPSTQVTNVTATNLAFTAATINWVAGNGNRRLVVLSDSPTFVDPVNGTGAALVATAVYGGSGQQIIFDGIAGTVNVTGLATTTQYYVKVYEYLRCGAGPFDSFYNVSTGTNQVTFSTLTNNDLCANAITVACGSTTVGTTAGSTNDNAAVCGISNVTIQSTSGVWYKFIGNGSAVTASTCSSGVNVDTRLNVFSGDCGTLTCITGNDDNPGCTGFGLTSSVTFSTALGTDYYILVYGFSSNSLSFTLGVTCATACSPVTTNNSCLTSENISLNTPLNSNNSCAFPSIGTLAPTCGSTFASYYDTWYAFNSDSFTSLSVSLVNGTSTAGFAVYSGACGTLTQINSTCTPTVPVTINTAANTDYFIRVFSTSIATRGNFTLSVTDPLLSNNSFDNASFSFYPNPVKNSLNLSYNQEISTVEVYNLLGQKVISTTINANTAQVDMSNVSKGAYMVRVTSNNQVKTIKVIKE